MKPKSIMLIAGEASGDTLAAELVRELRKSIPALLSQQPGEDLQPLKTGLEPRFFGVGGARMADAGVDLALDLTAHSIIGVSDVFRKITKIARIFVRLRQMAIERQPDAIICVDYGGFNLRFAAAIRKYVVSHQRLFNNWNPKIIQFVSPQVWASRPGRAQKLARSVDLLLSIFPFEKEWYAKHAPGLRVEFVGHPLVDRYASFQPAGMAAGNAVSPLVVLLPGSRAAEIKRHLPVMAEAWRQISQGRALRHRVVLPNEQIHTMAQSCLAQYPDLQLQVGGLPEALNEASLAIASTGTVTMECARFGVPTVALYVTTWSTYQIAKRIVRVRYIAMPNLLANEPVFPEFIQNQASAPNLAKAGLELLSNEALRQQIKSTLARVVESLGPPGAIQRAAAAIAGLLLG